MKKSIVLAGIIGSMLVFGTLSAHAQGFTGPGSSVSPTTVSEASKLYDHSPVVLQGNIVRSLGHHKHGHHEGFVFKDSTGEVVVQIDWHVWNGLSVNEHDTVEIFGYLDKKGWWIEKIEVKSIRKV